MAGISLRSGRTGPGDQVNDETVTPLMAQYLRIKAANPGALLFYRMGDFYELFFDDAVAASEALDIALTRRGKHLGEDIAMCGVPVHSAEGYLHTLIRKGFRVAVAEQLEDPAEARRRGSKAVVRRDVVRLVTPGTLTEDSLLDARRHNFLAAFAEVREGAALAWVDISTGEFRVMACPPARLGPELARLGPREVLLSEARLGDWAGIAGDQGAAVTPLGRASFDSTAAERRLCILFGVTTLEAYGRFDRAELSAMGAIVDYLELTQRGKLPLLRPPVAEAQGGTMQIDAATRRNLELTVGVAGGREGSLLATADHTVTAGGARLLERRLSGPSRDLGVIHARLEGVRFLVEDGRLRDALRADLRRVPDMDRALSRLALDRGGPRDLGAIRAGLEQAGAISARLAGAPPLLARAAADLAGHQTLAALLRAALVEEPPLLLRDGGFIAAGYDAELDETRRLRDEGRGVIAAMQAEYAAQAGVPSLKIKHNNVLGYFIETTDAHAERMLSPPLSETFIHRQTTANQLRFTTLRLSEMETRILNAGNHAVEIERGHFARLREAVLDESGAIAAAARALAEIDLAAGFADLAAAENWVEPVVNDSRAFWITGGRHPVVERALRRQGGSGFVANNCVLTTGETPAIWLLTGPNMAGKSTFLRQNALIAVLAQAGSFVPATKAHIGLVSQLFSRVGASDDLARGRSTFMVEMVETAAILNQADERALVILDEIGRGTATYDGLSIAWATLEHLHDVNRCRALFATHYHEMTALAGRLAGVENATVAVKEWDGQIIFLHEVREGAADRSYGVQVAKLAGLPAAVIDRARAVLEVLESGERAGGARPSALIDDLPLFRAAPAPAPRPGQHRSEVEARLSAIHPDELTPMEALRLIYELRGMLAKEAGSAVRG
jgi:DNA mismatch repair protein MutS